MKVLTNKKKLVLVFGLPRSGTTIICSYLNSLDNGFCVSEPILGSSIKPDMVCWDKIPACTKLEPNLIIEHCDSVLRSFEQFDLGGIKEIWTPLHRSKSLEALESGKFDKVLFVIRDPIDIFASWKSTTWGRQVIDSGEGLVSFNDYNWLCHSYEAYIELIAKFPSDIIFYDDFVLNPKKSLKDCGIEIVGDEKLRDNKYKLGDKIARESIKVEKTKDKRHLVNKHELKEIKNDSIYKEYLRIKEARSQVW